MSYCDRLQPGILWQHLVGLTLAWSLGACAPEQPTSAPAELPPVVAPEQQNLGAAGQLDTITHRLTNSYVRLQLRAGDSLVYGQIPLFGIVEVREGQPQAMVLKADWSAVTWTSLDATTRSRLSSALVGSTGVQADRFPLLWLRLDTFGPDTSTTAPYNYAAVKANGTLGLRGRQQYVPVQATYTWSSGLTLAFTARATVRRKDFQWREPVLPDLPLGDTLRLTWHVEAIQGLRPAAPPSPNPLPPVPRPRPTPDTTARARTAAPAGTSGVRPSVRRPVPQPARQLPQAVPPGAVPRPSPQRTQPATTTPAAAAPATGAAPGSAATPRDSVTFNPN